MVSLLLAVALAAPPPKATPPPPPPAQVKVARHPSRPGRRQPGLGVR